MTDHLAVPDQEGGLREKLRGVIREVISEGGQMENAALFIPHTHSYRSEKRNSVWNEEIFSPLAIPRK